MNEIKLIKPTMEFANDIMSFRQEVLDAKEIFDNIHSELRRECQTLYKSFVW